MKPAAAAEYIQRTVAVPLANAVPDSTKSSFERLRSTHVHGLFNYDLFTAAYEMAPLILEQALGERFVAYYQGKIPLVDARGQESPLEVRLFREIYDAFHKSGSHVKGTWSVRSVARGGALVPFRATYKQLVDWARHEQLLHGQRSRLFDKAMVDLRNSVAHRSSYHLTSPVESSRLICEVAEIINRVWGERTPGGRIYPMPVERHIFAVGWAPDGTTIARSWADRLPYDQSGPDWRYIVVRAVEADEALFHFDSDFESTHYPADLLWGPGTREEAIEWLAHIQPSGDHAEYLDRHFVLRAKNGKVDPARSPSQFLGLSREDHEATWYLIQADFPDDAFVHARSVALSKGECTPSGPCKNCWVTTLSVGDWAMVQAELIKAPAGILPAPPTGIRVPAHLGRWGQ